MRKLQIMGLGRTDWEKLQRMLGSLGTQDPYKLGRGKKGKAQTSSSCQAKAVVTTKPRRSGGGGRVKGVMRQHFPMQMQKVVLQRKKLSPEICIVYSNAHGLYLISLPLLASVSPYLNLRKSYFSPAWVSDPPLLSQTFMYSCLLMSLPPQLDLKLLKAGTVFYTSLHPQSLAQGLAYNKFLVNTCWLIGL